MTPKDTITQLFNKAGITIGKDIKILNETFYNRILAGGSLALGESYMDGWWESDKLDQFFDKLLSAEIDKQITIGHVIAALKAKLFNRQSKTRATIVAKEHYDLGNEMYMTFLDPYNQYTCGYFKDTTDLNEAQEKKLKLICEKLQLKKTDKVLDIGCGWGGFSKYAAKHYGCHVTGISISDEQIKYAKKYCKGQPVEIIKSDYRDFKGKFDKILVCGMIEHVGPKNYRALMECAERCLNPEGIFLLHTIGRDTSTTHVDPWIDKYIFPNSVIPSIKQLSQAAEGLFYIEDIHNFGQYYDPTLIAWDENFVKNWHKIKDKYDERFYRMFHYYFMCCAGAFRARKLQLFQIVYTRGMKGGYQPIR